MAVLPAPARRAASVPREAWALGILSLLFLLRVVGQVLVRFLGVRWLPPDPEWYSGLLPYPLLLPVQIILLLWMALINAGVTRQMLGTARPNLLILPDSPCLLRIFAPSC
jgi:hypothetical protein